MISTTANSAIAHEQYPATPIGLPTLCKMAFDGLDLAPVWNTLVHRVTEKPGDAAALLDLSIIAQLQGRPQDRRALQSAALKLQRIYRRPAAVNAGQARAGGCGEIHPEGTAGCPCPGGLG